ncbi:RNA polymerase sigma factor [Methylocapsa aurea]|uniref:RNA polymerase sigma factor n=1 Tax=Methylocapsa aurea TaxID=663610 RepID=UPI00055CF29C|nr:sigma factor-like helix-turn-helix DNA-binding protein [Methylocapsa aurea]
MNWRDDLNLIAPRLRRFARALVAGHPGPSQAADDLVQAALRRALENGVPGRRLDLDIHLYSLMIEMHRDSLRAAKADAGAALEKGSFYAGGIRPAEKMPNLCAPRQKLSGALGGLTLEEREALLLVALEGFGYAHAARILKISQPILIARLARARAALGDLQMSEPTQHKTKLAPTHLRVVK